MKHIIVTGGLGFCGSHITDAFLAAGHRVTIIDSEISSVTDGAEYDRHPQCTVHRMSVVDYFSNGFDLGDATSVIHSASHVGPASILQYAGQLGGELVHTTETVIDACREGGVPLCVFSSAEIYGRSGQLAEDDDIRVPASYNVRIEYAVAKTLIEVITANNLARGLRAIVVRPFNVAGPKQSRFGGFVVPTFIQQALGGRPITVFDTGEQVRAFLGASDLTRFMVENLDQAFDSGHLVFNLGNPENSITVNRLARRIKELLDSPSEIVSTDSSKVHGELYKEAESIRKEPVLGAALKLGWQPQVTLDQIILETAEFYRQNNDIRGADAPI